MRDYRYVDENGTATFVADLPTATIHELLNDRLYVMDDEGGNTTEANVIERLRIEIVARSLV